MSHLYKIAPAARIRSFQIFKLPRAVAVVSSKQRLLNPSESCICLAVELKPESESNRSAVVVSLPLSLSISFSRACVYVYASGRKSAKPKSF